MRVAIIEDETAAAINLTSLLEQTLPQVEIVAVIESVTDAVGWLEGGGCADLIFLDIHLADGNAFLIFEKTEVNIPIIFTTAYDQYALEAFKVNSIDYLLKPIKRVDIEKAVAKLRRFSGGEVARYNENIAAAAKQYTGFLLHLRDKIVPVSRDEIAFCYTFNERVTVYTFDGRSIPYDKSLDTIMERLPESEFYRINRQFVVSRRAVSEISIWTGSRLSVNLCIPTPEKIVVSKVRTPDFKRWIIDN